MVEHVYLVNNFDAISEFCTFGWKINLKEDYFWEKVQEKVMRMNPSTKEEIKKCLDIAFMMSKCEKGDVIYSKMKSLFVSV